MKRKHPNWNLPSHSTCPVASPFITSYHQCTNLSILAVHYLVQPLPSLRPPHRGDAACGLAEAAPNMSVSCGLECVLCLGCSRWAWKRLTYVGNYDSESWPPAVPEDFEPVPRMCRAILAIYEDDLAHPRFLPNGDAGGVHCVDPSWVVKRVNYDQIAEGLFPPYIIYADPVHRELVLAVRGLNLVREADYKVLIDNRVGREMFDGGYVHHGLLQAATKLLNLEGNTLSRKLAELGPEYKLVFAGHSLGSGIVALMTIVVVNHLYKFGGIPRSRVRCYCIAPARCMSLNLAVKYADVIHSVILQDDFLPRTSTPLEYIFGSIFCLPCFLFLVCMRDTFIPEKKKLGDPRRLYAPGRMYHIVERKFCRCGRYPPEVKTAIPVNGRFEHIVLSCNATSDHGIIWIEREAQKALKIMMERSDPTVPPQLQKIDRKQSLEKEHEDAIVRAMSLNVPHTVELTEVSHDATISEHPGQSNSKTSCAASNSLDVTIMEHPEQSDRKLSFASSKSSGTNWDELIQRLFTRTESGSFVVKKDININD